MPASMRTLAVEAKCRCTAPKVRSKTLVKLRVLPAAYVMDLLAFEQNCNVVIVAKTSHEMIFIAKLTAQWGN